MDLFKNNWNWRITTSIVATLLVVVSFFYTNHLVRDVARKEKMAVEHYKQAIKSDIRNTELSEHFHAKHPNISMELDPYTFTSEIIKDNEVPIILVDERGDIISANNFGASRDTDMVFLQKRLDAIQLDGGKALVVGPAGSRQYIYYDESHLISLLRYYPVVTGVLLLSFILVGFIGFRSEKASEQNRVWAGMAKETAHQLGTPISGMVAWLEHLKMMRGEDEEVMEIVSELEKDTDRMKYVAERFSKIGSEPELSKHDLTSITQNIFSYIARRAPRRVTFEFPEGQEPIIAMVNAPLFEWVLENLLRNALDATGKEGHIGADFVEDEHHVFIDISDTGKGIPDIQRNAIFKPGFTTKKRGWGLGLSLAKRIVESYHNGKIFVKESKVGAGTTFRIQLPKH